MVKIGKVAKRFQDWKYLRVLIHLPEGKAADSGHVKKRKGRKKHELAEQQATKTLAAWREQAPAAAGWFFPIDLVAAKVGRNDTSKARARLKSTGLIEERKVTVSGQSDDRTKYAIRLKRDPKSFVELWRRSWEAGELTTFMLSPYWMMVPWGDMYSKEFLYALTDLEHFRPSQPVAATPPDKFKDTTYEGVRGISHGLMASQMPWVLFDYLDGDFDKDKCVNFRSKFESEMEMFNFLNLLGSFTALINNFKLPGDLGFEYEYDAFKRDYFLFKLADLGLPEKTVRQVVNAYRGQHEYKTPPFLKKHKKEVRQEKTTRV